LDIANPRDAASRLDDDEKDAVGLADAIGRTQKTTIINESGLYSIILRSVKPEAKRFKKWITSEVLPSIRKTGGYGGKVPTFIRRYNDNWDRVDSGYFSVIGELTVRLWGRLEMAGHIMADRAPDGKEIRPDVSVGRLFADWLDENHSALTGSISYYLHKTPEWEGEARQYPISMLPLYIEFVDTVWIPEHSERYLGTSCGVAVSAQTPACPKQAKGRYDTRASPLWQGQLNLRRLALRQPPLSRSTSPVSPQPRSGRSCGLRLLVPFQFPLSPMRVFAIRVELVDDVATPWFERSSPTLRRTIRHFSCGCLGSCWIEGGPRRRAVGLLEEKETRCDLS
jgi:BRO family, N-terminal domain